MADLTHLGGRVPGPGGAAAVAGQHAAAAHAYVQALASGGEGAAARLLGELRADQRIDPWELLAHVAALALARLPAG